jgi:hypothetical protein
MFAVAQKFLGELKDRWSSIGPAVQLLFAAFAIIIPAAAALWLVDKLLLYYLARSYVDDVAKVFDLNNHLAKAISLAVFVAAIYLIGKTFSRSRASRRIGYVGILGLLIGHSLLLWIGTPILNKCYVLTHDGQVHYREHPGIDPMTGRLCRPVTPELIYRLEEYRKGRRPQRIASDDPTFFDPRSGEPSVWYFKEKDGTIELYDLMGFHRETGVELEPVTPGIVDQWRTQNADTIKIHVGQRPQRIGDPERFGFFDALTGKPRVWYSRSSNGEYEFYDNSGFHPATGEPLSVITKEAIAAWTRQQKQAADKVAERTKKQEQDAVRAAEQEQERQAEEQRQQQQAAKIAAEQAQGQQAASRCDQLAANPTDRRKPANVPGVGYDDLRTQANEAVEACLLAMKAYQAEQRFRYQYARALQINEPEKALRLHKELMRNYYAASYDNAGWLLIDTRRDYQQAIAYFKEGARRGDPDSAVSLAAMIDRQSYVPENDPTATKFALLSWAAQRGHPGAQLAVEQERIKYQQLRIQQQNQQQQEQLMMQELGAMIGTVLQNVGR